MVKHDSIIGGSIETYSEVGMVAVTEKSIISGDGQHPNQCSHHWVIDGAGGPTSKGICRLCGAEKDFKNYLEGARWDNDTNQDSGAIATSIARSKQPNPSEDES